RHVSVALHSALLCWRIECRGYRTRWDLFPGRCDPTAEFHAMTAERLWWFGRSYEYRSQMTIGSWPLLHIVAGFDPLTMRPRIARGIVAIGPISVGAITVGGVSAGLITVGGF